MYVEIYASVTSIALYGIHDKLPFTFPKIHQYSGKDLIAKLSSPRAARTLGYVL